MMRKSAARALVMHSASGQTLTNCAAKWLLFATVLYGAGAGAPPPPPPPPPRAAPAPSLYLCGGAPLLLLLPPPLLLLLCSSTSLRLLHRRHLTTPRVLVFQSATLGVKRTSWRSRRRRARLRLLKSLYSIHSSSAANNNDNNSFLSVALSFVHLSSMGMHCSSLVSAMIIS